MNVLKKALEDLKLGRVIAYPTEGVWGLGCDPQNEEAVNKLLKLKKRPKSKGLILVGSNMGQMNPYINTEEYQSKLISKWPGPHTWVVPTKDAPAWVRGKHSSVAVRVSSHPTIVEICNNFGAAIVSTSANIQGEKPLITQQEVKKMFHNLTVVEGTLGGLSGSTPIQDVVTDKWIRN